MDALAAYWLAGETRMKDAFANEHEFIPVCLVGEAEAARPCYANPSFGVRGLSWVSLHEAGDSWFQERFPDLAGTAMGDPPEHMNLHAADFLVEGNGEMCHGRELVETEGGDMVQFDAPACGSLVIELVNK
jgi:hypothetical protein